jgi:hypothetical protein
MLQPTMLVHEAYLRLVDVDNPQQWNGRGHFFGAAAHSGFGQRPERRRPANLDLELPATFRLLAGVKLSEALDYFETSVISGAL